MDSRRARSTSLVSVGVIVAACLLVGLPTVLSRPYFLADDFGLVQHLHRLPFQRLLTYFGSDWTEGIYGVRLDELRPVLAFSYWLDARLWGATNATGYHVTNVVLHTLNALLVLAIALSVAPGNRWRGLIAGTLFALMPCHAEPLAWISGRVDSLATLFYLGAFLCFVRFRLGQSYAYYAGALLLFTIGLFTKQSAVTLPAILLSYDVICRRGSRLVAHVPFFAILACYLVLRRALFGSALREDSLHLSLITEFIRRQAFYVLRLLPFSADDPGAAKLALGLLVLLIAGALIWQLLRVPERPLRPLLFFGPVWYAVTVSPMIVTYASARHLYLTAAGLCIAAALLIVPGDVAGRKRWIPVFACLVMLYGSASTRSILPWISNGVYSGRLSAELPAALRSIPPGSTVFLAIPAIRQKQHFWDFALPFALQAPFQAEDLYSKFSIVEVGEVYCCPPPRWWARLRPVLSSLTEARPVYMVRVDPVSNALVVSQSRMDASSLRERIERALAKPFDAAGEFTLADAARVSNILFPELETSP